MYSKFKYQNDRFGFAAPFLLGAVTGGVAGAAFSSYPRPYQYNNFIIHIHHIHIIIKIKNPLIGF